VILGLAVLAEHPLVTDRQTDGRTDRHMTMYHASKASGGKNAVAIVPDGKISITKEPDVSD